MCFCISVFVLHGYKRKETERESVGGGGGGGEGFCHYGLRILLGSFFYSLEIYGLLYTHRTFMRSDKCVYIYI